MKKRIAPLFLVAFAALGLVYACGDEAQCAGDSECFAGEWCNSGVCTVGERPVVNNNNGLNNNTNNIQINNINNDTIASTNNATVPDNNPTNNQTIANSNNINNTNGTNNTNQGTNNPDPGVCAADIFDPCDDISPNEPDDSWFDSTNLGSSGGCLNGDTITPRTYMVEGKICARDPGDWFGQIIVPCDERDVIVEVRVTTEPICLPEEWYIGVNSGGANIGCESERVECFNDGDTKVARWIVSPSGSIESWHFGVVNADVSEFEYSAVLEIR